MANWKESMSSRWDRLSARDKTILKVATPIIIFLLVFILVISPTMKRYLVQKAEYQQARETLTWLYNQAGAISRLQNSCGNRVFYMKPQEDPLSYARNLARRSSINADYSARGNDILVSVESAVGNRTLAFMQTLTCNGYEISDLQINRLPGQSDSVAASMKITPRALPVAK